MNLTDLEDSGFDIQAENHAITVLATDFAEPLHELCEILREVRIMDYELIQGGGGEAKSTQRLRRSLTKRGWCKHKIEIKKIVDGIERAAISHEIDHVRKTDNGTIALEIEWNNKDPFFDRDLDNFQRLHSEGAISAGVIVTRGDSLQRNLVQIVKTCADSHGVHRFEDLVQFGLSPTRRQIFMVGESTEDFVGAWAFRFVRDKFGNATTPWDKLITRIARGVGNPCPLLLIGIPMQSVHQGRIQ
ncbi:MAG: restriction endonuclease [Gammaproteobacteria bacterium]|nr:restriction endonuclease [Gammaproteobacteria bacterium]